MRPLRNAGHDGKVLRSADGTFRGWLSDLPLATASEEAMRLAIAWLIALGGGATIGAGSILLIAKWDGLPAWTIVPILFVACPLLAVACWLIAGGGPFG